MWLSYEIFASNTLFIQSNIHIDLSNMRYIFYTIYIFVLMNFIRIAHLNFRLIV